MNIKLENIYLRSENVVVRDIVGETMLVPISGDLADMERIFVFSSPVGRLIWNCLDGTNNLEVVLSKVLNEYEVERETAEADLKELIDDLLDVGLVRRVENNLETIKE